MAGRLRTDPLFLGLTRSAMVMGVSFMFFGMNIVFVMTYFTITSDFRAIILAVGLHLIGVVMTKKEPLAMEILLLRMQKCNGGKNKGFYKGLHSYGLF